MARDLIEETVSKEVIEKHAEEAIKKVVREEEMKELIREIREGGLIGKKVARATRRLEELYREVEAEAKEKIEWYEKTTGEKVNDKLKR